MKKNERLYVCSNFGEYAKFERYQKKEFATCGWSATPLDADLFNDYKDAYNHAKRINKYYGYERCRVEKLVANEWKEDFWERLLQSSWERWRKWSHQDYVRHQFAGLKL